MDLRRTLTLLLCLPALLAPSGASLALCLCSEVLPRVQGCCVEQEPACCCEVEGEEDAGAVLHAPCTRCVDIATPAGVATRAGGGQAEELAHAAMLPPAAGVVRELTAAAVAWSTPRPATNHAPPLRAVVPLRI